jgi:hypothetical protein
MKTTIIASGIFVLSLLPLTAVSDVLLIDAITQETPNSADGLLRPTRSMSMATVKARFGEPVQEHPWIGDPPISRWDYEGYSVYFENDLVLTTVVHR